MIVRDGAAVLRPPTMPGTLWGAPASAPPPVAAPRSSRRMVWAAQPVVGATLMALGVLVAVAAAAIVRGAPYLPAGAAPATLTGPASRAAPSASEPVQAGSPAALDPARMPALPATVFPPTLSVQHATILASAGPDTADAVRAYLSRWGRNLLSVQAGAITGPGRAEVLLLGANRGCASCHARWIAVWDVARQAPIWEAADGVDTTVAPAGDGLGFVRTDARWSAAGPACCHATWERRYLTWNGTTFAAQSVSTP